MINLSFLFRSLCLETTFLFMTDPESCAFSYEYAKSSLEDSKFLKMSIGFLKSTQAQEINHQSLTNSQEQIYDRLNLLKVHVCIKDNLHVKFDIDVKGDRSTRRKPGEKSVIVYILILKFKQAITWVKKKIAGSETLFVQLLIII